MSACPTGTCIMTRPCDGACILTLSTNLEPVDSIPGDAKCIVCGLTFAEHTEQRKVLCTYPERCFECGATDMHVIGCSQANVTSGRPKVVRMPTREPDFADQVSAIACLEDALAHARVSPNITHAIVLLVTESAEGFHIDQRCAGDQKMSDTLMYLTVAKNRVVRTIEGRD